MPGFHEILLDGVDGNPPRSRRARGVWELLRPPIEVEQETEVLRRLTKLPPPAPAAPAAPPVASEAPAAPAPAPERVEKRKRLEHSDAVQRLWGSTHFA